MIYVTTEPKSLAIYTVNRIIRLSKFIDGNAYDEGDKIIDPNMLSHYKTWVNNNGNQNYDTKVPLPLTHEDFLTCRKVMGEPPKELLEKFVIYEQHI